MSRKLFYISILQLLLSAFVICGTNNFGFANNPVQNPKTKTVPSDSSQQPNMDGVVEVSFKIDGEGKAEILQINASNPKLADYVIQKLAKIQLEQTSDQTGKVIKYRFVFKKQA